MPDRRAFILFAALGLLLLSVAGAAGGVYFIVVDDLVRLPYAFIITYTAARISQLLCDDLLAD